MEVSKDTDSECACQSQKFEKRSKEIMQYEKYEYMYGYKEARKVSLAEAIGKQDRIAT